LTVTLLLFEQEVVPTVSVRVNVVVTVGETVGLADVEVNPTGLDTQLYVLPGTTVDPMVVLPPEHIVLSGPVEASGKGFTIKVVGIV